MGIDGKKENDRFQMLKNYLQLGNNKFTLKDYKEYNLDNLDSPLRITFNFYINNYFSKLKDEIFLNPFLEEYGLSDDLNDQRMAGFKAEYKSIDDVNITLKIPEGYQLKHVPKNENIEYPESYFNSIFIQKEDRLHLKHKFVNDFIFMPKENYRPLKTFQNKIIEFLSETISLKKI